MTDRLIRDEADQNYLKSKGWRITEVRYPSDRNGGGCKVTYWFNGFHDIPQHLALFLQRAWDKAGRTDPVNLNYKVMGAGR